MFPIQILWTGTPKTFGKHMVFTAKNNAFFFYSHFSQNPTFVPFSVGHFSRKFPGGKVIGNLRVKFVDCYDPITAM
jgi:hypothetical protein